LPHAWKADLGFNVGGTVDRITSDGFALGSGYYDAINYGRPGFPGAPVPDPFGSPAAFAVAIQAYRTAFHERGERRSAFQDATVRLAGPLLRTGAGTSSLSLLAEGRHETVPEARISSASGGSTRFPPYAQTVSSLYGEVRAPLVPRERGVAPLRGLEVALAVRYDDVGSAIPRTGLIGRMIRL
jgi:hypothetical protein